MWAQESTDRRLMRMGACGKALPLVFLEAVLGNEPRLQQRRQERSEQRRRR